MILVICRWRAFQSDVITVLNDRHGTIGFAFQSPHSFGYWDFRPTLSVDKDLLLLSRVN